MKFTIPGRLAGLNEIVAQARYNRFAGASQKKKQTELCMFYIQAHRLNPVTKPVEISFSWIEPNAKRDIDNIAAGAKFVLDGLVAMGILPSDGRKWVKAISHRFPDPEPKNPRIEVTVQEL